LLAPSSRRPSEIASLALNPLDELFLHLALGEEPWNVHFEVRLREELDAGRLATAVRDAALRHPLARASLAEWRRSDRAYHWEIADALTDVPLTVGGERGRFLSSIPSLDGAPPFSLLLSGGALVLNLHHAAGDGVAAARLMRSILRAYRGEDDPAPPLQRDVQALAGPPTPARMRALMLDALRRWPPPTRIVRDGGEDDPGYGVETFDLPAVPRIGDASVNDVLLAALATAVRRWNAEHGRTAARITFSMPVNLRPAAWRDDVVGNFASYVSVSGGTVRAIARQTEAIKRDNLAGAVVNLVSAPLTVGVKRRLPDLVPLTGNTAVDTASLSNLGVLESLGDDVEAVAFSPPGRMPLGAAIGVVTHRGRMFATLRYRRAQFGPDAAKAFAHTFRDALLSADSPS
jgi:NRPS condensation-like uncharacterized protein